jgi:hypothetical protein
VIVKVQRAIVSTAGPGMVLVYDRKRKYVWQGIVDKKTSRVLGDEAKQFWHAHINKDGAFSLDRRAKWQNW